MACLSNGVASGVDVMLCDATHVSLDEFHIFTDFLDGMAVISEGDNILIVYVDASPMKGFALKFISYMGVVNIIIVLLDLVVGSNTL
jgi:hypothetical protein